MNWWVWQFSFSRIQLPFLGEILIDISKNPSEQIQFSHSKSLKRSWGWQHFKLYFCVVLAKNSQASSINCHVFLLQIIIKERQDCWSWLVSVEKSKLWKRWNVFVQCRDDQEMFLIIWKMTRTTLWAWFNLLSSQNRADYFDVTLVDDDSKYNLAHKVVLATSSAKCMHPHPLVNFDIATFRFRNFSMFFYGIGIGFEKNLVSEKVSVSVTKNFGIKKSIGIGFENFWYR